MRTNFQPIQFRGTVVKGLGEGAEYVTAYSKALEKQLGFDVYPGTLNIKVKELPKEFLRDPVLIKPPKKGLHPVSCIRVGINFIVTGALVLPKKTKHPKNIVELIASVNLREALGLKDGDEVVCQRLE